MDEASVISPSTGRRHGMGRCSRTRRSSSEFTVGWKPVSSPGPTPCPPGTFWRSTWMTARRSKSAVLLIRLGRRDEIPHAHDLLNQLQRADSSVPEPLFFRYSSVTGILFQFPKVMFDRHAVPLPQKVSWWFFSRVRYCCCCVTPGGFIMRRQVRGAGKRISSGIRPHQPASAKIVAPRRCKVAFDPVVPDGSAHPIVVDVQIPHAQEFQDRTTSADYSAVTEASIIHDTSVTGIPVQFLRVAPCCNTEPLSRTDFPYLLMRVRYSGSV